MPRVTYNISENARDEVSQAMQKERNAVVKERLLAVSMFLDGIPKGKIRELLHRGGQFAGIWITAYFNGGIEALADNRGGNHSSYLNERQMEELKRILTTSYPVYAKGWNGDIITDLIEYHFNVKYAQGSVYPLLKRLGLTHKIATKVDPKKSEVKIVNWKEDIKKTH